MIRSSKPLAALFSLGLAIVALAGCSSSANSLDGTHWRLTGWTLSSLDPADFGLVLSSPRLRARRTAELAGFTDVQVDERLAEWNYGDYEGRTSQEIRSMQPGWRIWTHPMPKGETKVQIITRMTEVVNMVRASGVDKAICFGHGHSSRVLALCWLDIDIARGQSFPLKTASVSIVGYEKESPAIVQWNA